MKSRPPIPHGYTYGNGDLLVPTHLVSTSTQQTSIEEKSPRNFSEPQPAECLPIAKRRPQRKPRGIQMYSPCDVDELEQSQQALSRGNDRRKNCEAMIALLRKDTPIGSRVLAKVPRTFQRSMDELENEMPNFARVVGLIRRLLALQVAGDGSFQLPPILLAGDPGVGKTYFAMRLAKLMGTGFDMINMEGATSPMSLIGLEQYYGTSSPGKVFDLLVRGRYANPVFVVDELDKASAEAQHPPANALYQLLEPNTAKSFRDQSCLPLRLNASCISWIVTANDLAVIPVPLLTRMTVLHVPAPTKTERVRIAACIYRDLRQHMSWGKRFSPMLPPGTASALASAAGSVRPMKSLLRLAFANAYLRRSAVVDPCDISHALNCVFPQPALEYLEPRGCA